MYTIYAVKVSVKRSNALSSPSVPIRRERKRNVERKKKIRKKELNPPPLLSPRFYERHREIESKKEILR